MIDIIGIHIKKGDDSVNKQLYNDKQIFVTNNIFEKITKLNFKETYENISNLDGTTKEIIKNYLNLKDVPKQPIKKKSNCNCCIVQ